MQRSVLASVAQLAIFPAQDLLHLGSEARLNTPGTVKGNWCWRLGRDQLHGALASQYRVLNRVFGRSDIGS
jgi:4-alpha-glucanotransferase